MRIRLWFLLALVLGLLSAARAQTTPMVQAAPTVAVSPLPAVTLPETDTIGADTSICEQNRKQSIGETSSVYDPGNTAENATVTYNALPCPTTWLAQITTAIAVSKLPIYISMLAFSVWMLGVIWVGVRLANGSEMADGRVLFVRLLISGWLVFGSSTFSSLPSEPKFNGNMGEFVRAGWVEAYKWGDATFAAPALKRAAEQTSSLGGHISNLATSFAALQIISEGAKGAADGADKGKVFGKWGVGIFGALGGLWGGAQGAANAASVTTQAGIVAINMVMPILVTYYLIIMGTGLATVLGSLILPLAGAMFIFSTSLGTQYIETWFKTVASAILMMAFMPVVFAGSLELGFVEPVRSFDASINQSGRLLDRDLKKIQELARAGKISSVEEFRRTTLNTISKTVDKVNFAGYLNTLLSSLVLMVFSLMAGIYLLRIAQNWIIEFLSGVAAAVSGGGGGAPKMGAGALSSSMGAAGGMASGVGARAASSLTSGGASASTATPKSSPSSAPSMASAGKSGSGPANNAVAFQRGGSSSSNAGPKSTPAAAKG